jgi:hypothetical protein
MSERLTKRDENGNVYYDWGCLNRNHWALGRHVDRLAAYEDTGLSPEQVQELAKAKADGRLVVLPCKVGDRVYSIYGYLNKSIQEDTVKHICVQDGEIRLTMDNTCTKIWERSAFATREEAEKALGGGQG